MVVITEGPYRRLDRPDSPPDGGVDVREVIGTHPHRQYLRRYALAVADLLAALVALVILSALDHRGLGLAGALALPAIVIAAKLSGRYEHDDMKLRRSTLDEVPQLIALAGVWSLLWSFLGFLADVKIGLGGGGVAVLWLLASGLLIGCRTSARGLIKVLARGHERVLIIGSAEARQRLAESLKTDPGARIDIVGFMPLEDERRGAPSLALPHPDRRRRRRTFDDLPRVVQELNVDRIFFIPTSADNETMLDAVTRTTGLRINVSIVPRLFEVVGSAVEFDSVGGVTVLGVRHPSLGRFSRLTKRTMDLCGAGLGLLLLSPLLLLVAIAIKLDTDGPVFFRQKRVGRDGRHFAIYKFRSMIADAEAGRAALTELNETTGLFKLTNDPRITRVGAILRRTSIDELPQLINVFLGDMSLVGPRPLILDEDRLIEGRHRGRLHMAPGMTGPWQVLGPKRPPLSEMVKTDYLYATSWSIWTDVKIVLRTFAHITAGRGL